MNLEREREFWDRGSRNFDSHSFVARFLQNRSPAAQFSGRLPRLDAELLKHIPETELKGKRVLVYGCGNDAAPIWFAKRGALVDAIDISEVSCENQRAIAREVGMENNIKCHVMDAHNITLPHVYDFIYGNAIIHHLNVDRASEEICRLLKNGGTAIFRDVKAGNLFLRLFRRFTPMWRTADEHPLTAKDVDNLASRFDHAEESVYIFLLLPYLFFERILNFAILPRLGRWRMPRLLHYDFFDRLDFLLFRTFPFLRSQAWLCLIVLKK